MTNYRNVVSRNKGTLGHYRGWEYGATDGAYGIQYAVLAQVPYLLGEDALRAEQWIHNNSVDVNGDSTNLNLKYARLVENRRVFPACEEFHSLEACTVFRNFVLGGGPQGFVGVTNPHSYDQHVPDFMLGTLRAHVWPYVYGLDSHYPLCKNRQHLTAGEV